MEYVDAHFHVWALEKFKYPWPTPGMKIYKDYYPCGLEKGIADTPVKHAVFVQCMDDGVGEAEWVMDMATRHPVIKGVVAGLDLTSPNLNDTILALNKTSGLLKGARHILDVEADDWITRDDVNRGLETLAHHNLTYDLLVRPCHLPYIPGIVSKHPKLKFIIDHIAKPSFCDGNMEGWKDEMTAIAKHQNVYCKISGIISEQRSDNWRTLDYQPFIDHVIAVFGVDKCIFGSDWPVLDLVDASYNDNFTWTQKLLSKLKPTDQHKIFRENAIKFYNLSL